MSSFGSVSQSSEFFVVLANGSFEAADLCHH